MFQQFVDRLDARQLRLLIGGGLLLLIALLFSYILLPQMKAYQKALTSKTMLLNIASQGQAVSLQLQDMAAEVEALKKELHGDMANLPEKQLEAFVIGRLQTISWRNNVELLSIEPQAGETVQVFSESLFKVELAGNYFELFDWLGEINEQLGFVVIKEYQMQPIENVAENPRLTVNLTIASYRVTQS